MEKLVFPVRYFCRHPKDESLECTEPLQHQCETQVEYKPAQTAFILVDVWNTVPETEAESGSFGEVGRRWASLFRGGKSLGERVYRITKERIRPALDAARKAGITIIHAPTEHVAVKYEQYHRLFPDSIVRPAASDWPPPEVRKHRTERILRLLYGEGAEKADKQREATYDDISSQVKPQPQDYIFATSEQANQILKENGIINLVYVGFATNLCLFSKPGGLMEMWDRGYNIVVLRDCTATLATRAYGTGLCDEVAVEWLEAYSFFTADSKDFINACIKD